MFCENCGNELYDNTGVCPVCGSAVTAQADPVTDPATQQQPIDPAYQQPYDPAAQQPYDPAAQQPYDPAYQQPYDPAYQQPYDPNYQQPYQQQPYQQQPYQQQPYQQVPAGTQKSKLAAGLLGIFLGSIGVHNFYLGYTGKALVQLLVSLLSFGFLAPAMAIWALIEGIFYLTGHDGYTTDANGVPLGE